jgi:hypothetical protein
VSIKRPIGLAFAAVMMSAALIPLTAHPARADVPPPHVEPPGMPYGTCSAINAVASSQDNPCKEEKSKWDDYGDDKWDEKEKDEKNDFPFNDDDGGDDD